MPGYSNFINNEQNDKYNSHKVPRRGFKGLSKVFPSGDSEGQKRCSQKNLTASVQNKN
jgi:hypothetical protein